MFPHFHTLVNVIHVPKHLKHDMHVSSNLLFESFKSLIPLNFFVLELCHLIQITGVLVKQVGVPVLICDDDYV